MPALSLTRLLWLAAAAMAVPVILAFLHERWWVADILVHFRAQYALLLLLVLAAAALLRAAITALASSALLAVNLWAMHLPAHHTAPTAPVDQRASPSLKLMTYNAYYLNDQPAAAMRQIGEADADIVLIQEFANELLREGRFLRPRYTYFYPDEDKNWSQLGVLAKKYRQDFTIRRLPGETGTAITQFSFDEWPEKGWPAFTVISVHTQSPRSAYAVDRRNAQLQELAVYIKTIDTPLIVAGDFNTSAYSRPFQELLESTGLKMVRPAGGWWPTWPGGLPRLLRTPIDHILVSEGVETVSFQAGHPAGSDHAPLIAALQWR